MKKKLAISRKNSVTSGGNLYQCQKDEGHLHSIYYAALNTFLNIHSEHIVFMIEAVRGF